MIDDFVTYPALKFKFGPALPGARVWARLCADPVNGIRAFRLSPRKPLMFLASDVAAYISRQMKVA